MTEETRKLFNAPWTVYGEPDDYSYVIQNASEDEIATVFMTDEAKRITHLPELYDALNEMMDEIICAGCARQPMSCGSCGFTKYNALLKKVRDGV